MIAFDCEEHANKIINIPSNTEGFLQDTWNTMELKRHALVPLLYK